MFDTHIHKTTSAEPYPQTVTNVRAPTDKSIELWEEYRKKAFDSIFATIPLDSTPLTAKMVCTRTDFLQDKIYIGIKLNGTEFVYEHIIPIREYTDIQDAMNDIVQGFSVFLASKIVFPFLAPSLPQLGQFIHIKE